MKFLPSPHNALIRSAVTVENPVASAAIARTINTRTGGGMVRGTGAYTGQADATFDVEVVNDTISGTPRVSAPVFNGVGNAVLSALTADGGTPAQRITLTLADLGTETRSAYTPFQGFTLQAKTAGADANYIEITIDESGLTRTATTFALLADLQAGNNQYTGDEWNFGGKPRNPDGTIPTDCPRISFGDDPQVYRQFKVFTPAGYVYSFTPAPVRTVPKGAAVKAVTGGRSITVEHTLGAAAATFVVSTVYTAGQRVVPITPNGHWYEVTVGGTSAGTEPTWPTNGGTVVSNTVTFIDRGVHTNTYTSIVTLFDALTAIHGDADSLISVVEPIVNDLNFDGMGITDLSVRTGAYVQAIEYSNDQMRRAGLSVAVAEDAPTEELLIRCNIASPFNAEVFEVSGSVSGVMALAVTGVEYVGDNYTFTIPENIAPELAPSAQLTARLFPQASGVDGLPQLCVEPGSSVLGALAQPFTYIYEWVIRRTECGCDDTSVVGNPDPVCLGIDPETVMAEDLPSALKTRAQTMAAWEVAFIEANTQITSAATQLPVDETSTVDGVTNYSTLIQAYSAVLKVDRIDVAFAKAIRSMFYANLRAMYDHHAPSAIPTAALTMWDTAWSDMDTALTVTTSLDNNAGASFWTSESLKVQGTGTGASIPEAVRINKKIFIEEFQSYMERYRAQLDQVLVEADIEPDFDSSGSAGTGCWTDREDDGWFVARNSDLLPIQPGYYYNAARRITNEDGTTSIVGAQLFGIGLDIGCRQYLVEGDRLEITIGETGTSIRGYQQGDSYRVAIAAGSAVQLGGGQIGDDTLTLSVVSDVDGALADYEFYKPSPVSYQTQNAGEDIDFLMTEGGIPLALGDSWVWYIEGGEFRWRKNGGSWSSDTAIAATVALSDGVSAAFDPGSAPSFIPGDSYTLSASAVNGGAHLASLTYGGIVTTEILDTVDKHRITIIPTVAETASHCVLLFRDPTEVGATVTLRGFATSGAAEGAAVFSVSALTNGSQQLHIETGYTPACAKWTITYYSTSNTPTTMGWLWAFVGDPLEMLLVSGRRNGLAGEAEIGEVSQSWRLPKRSGRRSAFGVRAEFSAVHQQSIEDLRYALEQASISDGSRIGILARPSVPAPTRARDSFGAAHTAYPEAGIVTVPEQLDLTDVALFQPTVPGNSMIGVALDLGAI